MKLSIKPAVRPALVLTALLLPAGCASTDNPFAHPPGRSAVQSQPVEGGGWSTTTDGSRAVLYARDGSPVGPRATLPSAERVDGVGHPLEKTGGSRLVLLDLYQLAVDERDELMLEVTALGNRMAEQKTRIEGLEQRVTELEATNAALDQEKLVLQDRGFDLAARLTTAQIRRLEAEKVLLESTLEWQRLSKSRRYGAQGAGDDQ